MRKLVLLVALFAVAALAASLLRTPDIDPALAFAKYANGASQFVENEDGLRVHYRDQGNPNGRPIVLVHGTSASLHTWEPLIGELADNYRIITYTQPGHGLTGPHPRDDYTFAGMAEALDLVTEQLGLERFVLGGNSMGGWVAWRYALARPGRVDALVLLDAAGAPLREGEEAPPLNLAFRLIQWPIGRMVLEHVTPRRLIKKSLIQTVSVESIATEDMVDRYWELLRLPGNRRAAAQRALADRKPAMFDEAHKIDAPTLIIWGENDQLIYASAAQTFRETIPDSEAIVYKGIGHLPMEEAPARTASDIDAFLKRRLDAPGF